MIELRCAPPDLRPTLVRIGSGPASDLAAVVEQRLPHRAVHVLIDERVAAAHPGVGSEGASRTTVAGGESLKTFAGLEGVLRSLVRAGIDRDGTLIAVGGGSVGDLGGLAAALHVRGIDLVMVPTTLLAMVDSSVGGKTAVNLPEGKNLAGVFWPAREVWIDPGFVATLPETEWRSGLGEVLKVAIGLDAGLFADCERDADRLLARDPAALVPVIAHAIAAKIRVVESDPREAGPRRLLNLGHTLGHALEAHAGFTMPHGIAVARGIHHAVDVSESRGTLGAEEARRCRDLLRRFGFEPHPLPPAGELMPFLLRDKKRAGDAVYAVLPTAIGRSRAVELDPRLFAGPA